MERRISMNIDMPLSGIVISTLKTVFKDLGIDAPEILIGDNSKSSTELLFEDKTIVLNPAMVFNAPFSRAAVMIAATGREYYQGVEIVKYINILNKVDGDIKLAKEEFRKQSSDREYSSYDQIIKWFSEMLTEDGEISSTYTCKGSLYLDMTIFSLAYCTSLFSSSYYFEKNIPEEEVRAIFDNIMKSSMWEDRLPVYLTKEENRYRFDVTDGALTGRSAPGNYS